jgi:putative iron-only hydrogenase system regulator
MCGKENTVETRVAVIGIIVENPDSVERVNEILHRHAPYILGRMGIPYRERGVSILSIALDAPQDVINALSGALGKLPGVSAKTAYSHLISKTEA